jgi:Protein of unknown function (DUF3987)/Domain of unknown function (DUF3854)
MSSIPYKLSVLLRKLEDAGCGPIREEGEEFRCRCPGHEDNGPSLYVEAREDRILIRCNAGCSAQAVCDRLDHDMSDLFLTADEPMVETEPDLIVAEGQVSSNSAVATMTSTTAATVPADIDLRHAIYFELLERLELSTSHFEDLRRRGLSAEEIARRGYKTADASRIRTAVDSLLSTHGGPQLLTVPGFAERNGYISFLARNGFLIPARDPNGRIIALKVRHDAGHNGPKYSWASTRESSCGNPVHVPLGAPTPAATIRLTEGELKADIATVRSGIPTISAPGVGNWELAVPVLQELGAGTVLLAMDMDGKPGTLAAVEKAIYGLTKSGFTVSAEWWDSALGKGIDDLLAAGHQPEVIDGLQALVRIRETLAAPASVDQPEPEPEPFPVGVLPPALAAYCEEVARATSTPPDFAGVTMLVTAGAALGNSRALCLKSNVWYEAPLFYFAAVGHPSSGKTPAQDSVLKPYHGMQSTLIRSYQQALGEYETAKAEYEQALKENRSLPSDERVPLPPAPTKPPNPERFVAGEATVESLAPLLADNPRGLVMVQDEGVGWTKSMGQYKGGHGNDRQFWLANFSRKSHLVDRKSQGAMPINIPRPFVSVICGIQPEMLSELADHQGRNDGFLHRILFVLPTASSGADWTDHTVSDASRTTWVDTLTHLRAFPMEELDDGPGHKAVHFSAEAKQAWIAWWDEHAAEIRSPELPAQLISPWGKLRTYAARLTIVLYYLWLVQGSGDEGHVDVASVQRAIRLINYFKSHLRLVYGRLHMAPEDHRLFEVINWIRQHGGRCTARDLVRARQVSPTGTARKALTELVERGYGRLEPQAGGNGRNVQWFILDPSTG